MKTKPSKDKALKKLKTIESSSEPFRIPDKKVMKGYLKLIRMNLDALQSGALNNGEVRRMLIGIADYAAMLITGTLVSQNL